MKKIFTRKERTAIANSVPIVSEAAEKYFREDPDFPDKELEKFLLVIETIRLKAMSEFDNTEPHPWLKVKKRKYNES